MRGRLGLLELRGFEMPPHPDMALVQALLVRALLARFAEEPYSAPLIRWGTALHERFLLPHFAMADIAEVVADLRAHGFEFDLDLARRRTWSSASPDRCRPRSASSTGSSCGRRSSRGTCSARSPSTGGTARYVDSSTERLQVRVTGFEPARQLLTCNGPPVPLAPTGTPGSYVAGVRYKAWKPWSALHPTLEVDTPARLRPGRPSQSRSPSAARPTTSSHPGGRAYDTRR